MNFAKNTFPMKTVEKPQYKAPLLKTVYFELDSLIQISGDTGGQNPDPGGWN